jgi:starch synthase (maltosyl-transferring)
MSPAPGERLLRFVGDRIHFNIRDETNSASKNGSRGFLRTNLGRAAMRRREIISSNAVGAAFASESWRDLPMQKNGDTWEIEFPLAEVGYFKAKPYLLDANRRQFWPDGPNAGVSVHPNFARTANTIYCAFTRLFGATKNLMLATDEKLEAQLKPLDAKNFTIIPPSGTLRDLKKQLPHIVQTLGCRILHLLPIHPTPTTYARFGRFGSPYAALDLTAIDPALVEFDKRTTGVDQFCELTSATHGFGARVFLDIVINHTGWGSVLQENSPEFFLKNPDGEFASPGAWGTIWEDLVELKQDCVVLWDKIADALLIWCRRGTDGFRCDAGYKIPVVAWQYIIARVHDEFPETIFLLEGLGGSWEATENLLTEGGMQWAYSELFQNYSGHDVAWYLDYANRQSASVGTYVHYSETHDNDRLAAKVSDNTLSLKPNRAWSLLRNRLCALTSPSGGFGFSGGVEWLATEKIRVHGCTGLNWDSPDNIVPELAQLNGLISNHPCFFDGAKLTRLSPPDSAIYLLLRESAEGKDSLLIVVNNEANKASSLALPVTNLGLKIADFKFDLLGQPLPEISITKTTTTFNLKPATVYCLATTAKPVGLSGDDYRVARAQAAFAIQSLNLVLPIEKISNFDWKFLAEQIKTSPQNFFAAATELKGGESQAEFLELIQKAARDEIFPGVITWSLIDRRRVTLIPANHWLLVEDSTPFRAALRMQNGDTGAVHAASVLSGNNHVAVFAPREISADAQLVLERHATTTLEISGAIRFLPPEPPPPAFTFEPSNLVLLTNGIGGMARLCVDLGRVNSKYDCVLGANLDPNFPVDRHIFVKRMRVWVNADGFISPLNFSNLSGFEVGPPVIWNFVANAGDGRTVEIILRAEMLEEKNTVVFQFARPATELGVGKPLPSNADVRLTVRFDIEDRNFHQETKRNGGADYHFSTNTHLLDANDQKRIGFAFTPDKNRQLHLFADAGEFHPEPEWCENIPHPVEASRGQVPSGDAYSPGWFEIPLAKGTSPTFVVSAENPPDLFPKEQPICDPSKRSFDSQLLIAAKQFVVRRDEGKTIIAGYPWFLDWGRDSLICARGLLAAGMVKEVEQLLLTFAKFEQNGTLPNTIHGSDVSNRDTIDAPLWFAVVCQELAKIKPDFYFTLVDGRRTIQAVLNSIAENYSFGTPNGIRMDTDSALIWSPSHFTWMDTNFPAGTPREGYPVEIQALWISLLRQLQTISSPGEQARWGQLADHATASFENLFWLPDKGWLADVLLGPARVIARDATPSDALRSNCLLAVSLGLVKGVRAKRCVAAAQKYLAVPGALRSLAPLPVSVPLPVYNNGGAQINDPVEPYWPRYEGDEDTRRKPAYHNGTAWTWTFPVFCEALVRAWDFAPEAVAAANSYLASGGKIMNVGCLGQIPEILDGDVPHTQRGCDAQAWGVTEFLRVSKFLAQPGA